MRTTQTQGKTGVRYAAGAVSVALMALLTAATPAIAAGGAGNNTDLTDLSIEELMNVTVSGASKYEQKMIEAPSSVSVITADDIRMYGYRTFADILRSVRSFYVTYDRNYSYVGARGFGRPVDFNTRVLLLIDGHRINENIYDSFGVGTDGIIDVDLIERVEVIRGPGSSLYGSNAFFAVVNVITRRGKDISGFEASGEAGSYKTSKGRISYGGRSRNGFDAVVSGSAYGSKGQDLYYREFDPAFSTDPRATNNGVAENADYDRANNFYTKLSYQDVILAGAYASRTKGIPTGSFGADFNEPGNKTTDTTGYIDLSAVRHIDARTDLSAALSYNTYQYKGDFLYSGTLNKDEVFGEWWRGELKLTTRVFDSHRIIVGVEYQSNQRQDQKNFDVSPPASYTDDKQRSHFASVYAQDEVTLSKTLLLNAGVRYDHYESFGGTVNPRLALIYALTPASSAKVLYGTAFRAPNVYESFYNAPTSAPPELPNPELTPEKIATYELVYEQYLGSSLRGTATAFYYEIRGLIDRPTDAAAPQQFSNAAKVTTRGAELELEKKAMNGVSGRISYSFQHSEDAATAQIKTNSPEHLAKLNLIVPMIRSRVFTGIEEQYVGRRETGPDDQRTVIPGFFLTNLTVFSRHLADRLELSASVYNLFDEHYADPVSADFIQSGIEQDGRTYRVKLTYRF